MNFCDIGSCDLHGSITIHLLGGPYSSSSMRSLLRERERERERESCLGGPQHIVE